MVYCKECVRNGYCSNFERTVKDSIECRKYKDSDYNDCSSDGDCDTVSKGQFGNMMDTFTGSVRNNLFRDVERVAVNCA